MFDNSARDSGGSSGSGDTAAHRERLRTELLAAAEAEAEAIVEMARQEIAVAVRRAHRDLLLIRAQLELHGADSPTLGSATLEPLPIDTTEALPTVAPELPSLPAAPTEAVALPEDPSPSVPGHRLLEEQPAESDVDVTPATSSRFPPMRALTSPPVIAALVLVLFVTGGVTGWVYWGKRGAVTSTPKTGAAAQPAAAVPARTSAPTQSSQSAAGAKPDEAGSPGSSPQIRVETTRPVWLRLDVDDGGDTGRLYPAGVIKELTPTRSLVIRAGDAGAVMVGTGAEPMAPLGAAGQVLTRRIEIADGRIQPAVKQPDPVAASASPASAAAPVDRVASEPPRPAARVEPQPPAATPSAPPTVPVTNQSPTPTASTPVAPPPPAPARAAASADPGPAAAPAPQVTAQQHADILARHSQWLEAYARGDQRTLASVTAQGFSLRDERPAAGAGGKVTIADSQISEVRIDVVGIGAVLSARLRTTADGAPSDSMLSEVWVRGDQQQWMLMGVRITPVEGIRRPGR